MGKISDFDFMEKAATTASMFLRGDEDNEFLFQFQSLSFDLRSHESKSQVHYDANSS